MDFSNVVLHCGNIVTTIVILVCDFGWSCITLASDNVRLECLCCSTLNWLMQAMEDKVLHHTSLTWQLARYAFILLVVLDFFIFILSIQSVHARHNFGLMGYFA